MFTNITNSIHIYREESSTLQEHLLNFYAQASDHLKLKYFYNRVTYGYDYIGLLYFSSSMAMITLVYYILVVLSAFHIGTLEHPGASERL